MYNTNNATLPVSIPLGVGNNGGAFGGNTFEDIIALAIVGMIFGWGGYGGGYGFGVGQNTSVYEGYVLNNDFSVLSNQMSQGFASQERKLDGISNGICSLGYDQLSQMNGINTNILTTGNALQGAVKDCCCQTQQNIADVKYTIGSAHADTNYAIATQANMLDRGIADGFCKTNFNNQTNTRDIIDSQSAGTRAILDKLCQMEVNAKDEKIAELTARNADLRLAASQQAQNSYLLSELKPCPQPAYVVPNPYCNCNCGQNLYGTTIA